MLMLAVAPVGGWSVVAIVGPPSVSVRADGCGALGTGVAAPEAPAPELPAPVDEPALEPPAPDPPDAPGDELPPPLHATAMSAMIESSTVARTARLRPDAPLRRRPAADSDSPTPSPPPRPRPSWEQVARNLGVTL